MSASDSISTRVTIGTVNSPGPTPGAKDLANQTNQALNGWRNETIDLAGKKNQDGKTDLDIFNTALSNHKDKAGAEAEMVKNGMSQQDADKAWGALQAESKSESDNAQIAKNNQANFENVLNPDQKAQYDKLQQQGDKKAITEFENQIASQNPHANEILSVKRQADMDTKFLADQRSQIDQAGDNVSSLPKETVGTVVSPADESSFKADPNDPNRPDPNRPLMPEIPPSFGNFNNGFPFSAGLLLPGLHLPPQ